MLKRQHSSTVLYSVEAPPKAALLSNYFNVNTPPNNLPFVATVPNQTPSAINYQSSPIGDPNYLPYALLPQPNNSFMPMSSTMEQEEEAKPQHTIASHFKREPLNPIHSFYIEKLQGLEKEESKLGYSNLVLGYFNKYLNQKEEHLFVKNVDNVDEPDLKCNF